MKYFRLSLLLLFTCVLSANAQWLHISTTNSEIDIKTDTITDFVVNMRAPYEKNNGHSYVDLGLSVKWATCNIGATKPYEYGCYFAWGETTGYTDVSTKRSFDWTYYSLCYGSKAPMRKYFSSTEYSYATPDYKTSLEIDDDMARANWGGTWFTPYASQIAELCNSDNCTWTWYPDGNTEFHGVAGYKVQSKIDGYTDNYIFLPAAGEYVETKQSGLGTKGYYWTKDRTDQDYNAYYMKFTDTSYAKSSGYRCYGLTVRAVCY